MASRVVNYAEQPVVVQRLVNGVLMPASLFGETITPDPEPQPEPTPTTSYVTIAAVALRMGTEVADLNSAQVAALIADVSALVDAYTGLDFSTQTTVPAAIRWVVASRVIRALNNPDGIKQETLGAYSYTLAADSAVLAGGWTEEERGVLNSYGNVGVIRRAGSFAIGY